MLSQEEIAGIVVLIALGSMLIGAIKVFGVGRVALAIAGVAFMAFAVAFRVLSGPSGRRY